MNDIGIISPAMIKLFIECAGKFYYKYLEQIPTPMLDKNFLVGKNIHALASYFLKGEDVDKFEKTLTEKECDFWNFLKNNKYLNYDIVGVEKNITIKLSDYWLGGRIDAIVKKEDEYYILDYKTGGVEEDMIYDPQTMVYLLLCDRYFEDYKSLSFVYMDLKNKEELKILFTPELKEEYEKRLVDICSKIINFNMQKFVRLENCACEYSKICK